MRSGTECMQGFLREILPSYLYKHAGRTGTAILLKGLNGPYFNICIKIKMLYMKMSGSEARLG